MSHRLDSFTVARDGPRTVGPKNTALLNSRLVPYQKPRKLALSASRITRPLPTAVTTAPAEPASSLRFCVRHVAAQQRIVGVDHRRVVGVVARFEDDAVVAEDRQLALQAVAQRMRGIDLRWKMAPLMSCSAATFAALA